MYDWGSSHQVIKQWWLQRGENTRVKESSSFWDSGSSPRHLCVISDRLVLTEFHRSTRWAQTMALRPYLMTTVLSWQLFLEMVGLCPNCRSFKRNLIFFLVFLLSTSSFISFSLFNYVQMLLLAIHWPCESINSLPLMLKKFLPHHLFTYWLAHSSPTCWDVGVRCMYWTRYLKRLGNYKIVGIVVTMWLF